MFSDFFIKRPIFATVLALLMVFAGLLCLNTMPVAQYPDITPPTVMVSASYPGANATTVAQTIGVPIEQQVNGVDGMLYMSSSSSDDGSYSLTITFENGTDLDQAAIDVQNRVSMAQGTLPNSVIEQGIDVMKNSTNQVLFAVLKSDDPKRYDALYLTNYAQLNVIDPLSRVSGVGDVSAFGAGEYSMRIWLDADKMKARGITPQQVSAAIQAQNMEVSSGSVGAAPSSVPADFSYTLVVNGRLSEVSEFENIIINSDSGAVLRLRDVARVELGSSSYSGTANVNGEEVALIGVSQTPGANALDVADGTIKELDRLSPYFPDGVHYAIVMNSTDYVRDSISDVLVTFAETSLIVLIVILIFLQNWRAVVIPMLTIPVSLIGTLAVMKVMGFSLNTLTLFGLVLAIAIVVDDAIVVVEDCSGLVDKGVLNRTQAAKQAMKELTGPVVGEVLVLLSVFIPTAFVSGITGSLYKQFALTIAVSTAFSGFNALTLTPALCALFLKPREDSNFFIYRWFNYGWNKLLNLYKLTIGKMLIHARWALAVFALIAGAGIYAFVEWPTSYIPSEDMGYFMTSIQLSPGASLERTEKVVSGLAKEVQQIPEVKDVMSMSGNSFLGGSGSNMGSLMVTLKPYKDRKGKEGEINSIMDKVNRLSAKYNEAEIFSVNPPAIPGLGMSSGLQMQLLDINNLGTQEMMKALKEIERAAQNDSRIASVTSMFQGTVPQYKLNFDRDRAMLSGVGVDDIYNTLSSYTGNTYVNDFTDFGRSFQVTMKGEGNTRAHVDDILNLAVKNESSEMVPFSVFTKVEPIMGVSSVDRYNMYTTASLTATPAKNVSSSQAIQAMEEIVEKSLGKTYSYAWTGQAYQETQAGTTISFVFIFAVVMTLLVLAAQYESWTSPIAVILAMPVAIVGTVLGVMFMNQSISIYTQIGLILLLGMAAKNAILIVEYAQDFRKTGLSINESAQKAGVIRFRPIMMTALAFVFGVMPMLFSTGPGANSRIEIGTAIVFGMALNGFLGTLFVPNFWKLMQGIQEKYLTGLFPEKKPARLSSTSEDNTV